MCAPAAWNKLGNRDAFVRYEIRHALEGLGLLRPAHPRFASTGAANWNDSHKRLLARLLERYVPGPHAGNVSLLWTDESAPQSERFNAEWRRVAPAAITGRIPGTHLTSITRHLAETSRILAEHVLAADNRTGDGTKGQHTGTMCPAYFQRCRDTVQTGTSSNG